MTNNLDSLREKIDTIDARILRLLSQRMKLVLKVGSFKNQHGITPLDKNRWQKVLDSKLLLAQEFGLDTEMVRDIYERIHKAALKLEASFQKKIKL